MKRYFLDYQKEEEEMIYVNTSLFEKQLLSYSDNKSLLSEYIGTDLILSQNKNIQYFSIPGLEYSLKKDRKLAEILIITSYPPRECGIATYSQDLIKSLDNKFGDSLSMRVCVIENINQEYEYPKEVKYVLNTSSKESYKKLAKDINNDDDIKIVLIQHEFGFYKDQEQSFIRFMYELTKPISIVFHTVIPHPNKKLKSKVRSMSLISDSIVVMTKNSSTILKNDYGIDQKKISIIPHGTHSVIHTSEKILKKKYNLTGYKVLTTFGLLSSGKNIETTLDAIPNIIKIHPEVMFLVIGKTHPEVVKRDGEKYRDILKKKIKDLNIENNVRFIDKYLDLPELLEYLQLTDIYLFTTNDPNQAVSGTFSYAMSCACPIISTPIPHAKEVLTENTGIIFDFHDSKKLSDGVLKLLDDDSLRKKMSLLSLQKIVSTSWENSSISHTLLFQELLKKKINIHYNIPEIKLDHMIETTTDTAMIQFSKINIPDIESGYTLDDNARALVVMSMYYSLTKNKRNLSYVDKYLSFIEKCLQPDNTLLNYVDKNNEFTEQNGEVDLNDSNGRALWSLGYLTSFSSTFPLNFVRRSKKIIEKMKLRLDEIHSLRSMAFAIKGLYYYQKNNKSIENVYLIETFADRLIQSYKSESNPKWKWFEEYMTYANSILPEALLFAWRITGNTTYKDIAIQSFNFLLEHTFNENGIEVISNLNWFKKGSEQIKGKQCEQPIDVAYTIMTLSEFYDETKNKEYYSKMNTAFNWFLGHNRLHQIVYNPTTGGCYDGLGETHVNVNQGAESTLSYLMARLTIQKYN